MYSDVVRFEIRLEQGSSLAENRIMKGLKMDTSNISTQIITPLSVVLGERQIQQSQLSEADWRAILESAFSQIKPRLKYLTGFKELREHLNFKIEGGWFHPPKFVAEVTDQITIRMYNVNVSACTRLLEICSLPYHTAGGEDQSGDRRTYHHLMTTQSGELLILLCSYVKSERRHEEYAGHLYRAEKVIAQSVTFEALSLAQKIKCHSEAVDMCIGGHILDHFYKVLMETITARERWIKELKEASKHVESMRSRIKWLSTPAHMI